MIECISYERVNNLYFNDSPEKAIEVFGEPDNKIVDREGNTVFIYPKYTISFDKNKKFFYFALHPKEDALINGNRIGWTFDKIKSIISLDSNPQESAGFIVLRDIGVAIVDFHTSGDEDFSDKTIVCFRKGELKANKETEQPFSF